MPSSPSRSRRLLKRAAAFVGVLVVVIAGLLAAIIYPVFKSYPAVEYPAVTSPAEQSLQDLDYLRRMPEVDRSFSAEARIAFDRALDDLTARAAELDRAALAMGAARAVALADNGHTNILELAGGHEFNGAPFRLGWFSDGLFVVSAAAEHSDLLGARILAINGRTPDQIVAALRHYVGGPASLVREVAPNFMISPELLHAADLGQNADLIEIEARLKDGTGAVRTVMATPGVPEPLVKSFWPKRDLSPVPDPDNSHAGWVHVLDGIPAPSYLSQPDRNFWHLYLDDESVLYVQLNRMRDDGEAAISDDLSRVLDEAATRRIKHAIVDLRFNPGGNYLLATDFSRRLPDVVPADGKVLILISGNTFSAAISTAARLKYYAGDRGVLIGETMGDRGESWGEGGNAVLPNSKIAVRFTTGYHDWENGCGLTQIATCFFLNYVYGVAAGPLSPTIARAATFAEYAAGEDVVLGEALKLAAVNR